MEGRPPLVNCQHFLYCFWKMTVQVPKTQRTTHYTWHSTHNAPQTLDHTRQDDSNTHHDDAANTMIPRHLRPIPFIYMGWEYSSDNHEIIIMGNQKCVNVHDDNLQRIQKGNNRSESLAQSLEWSTLLVIWLPVATVIMGVSTDIDSLVCKFWSKTFNIWSIFLFRYSLLSTFSGLNITFKNRNG